jgi:hypothetical protein
MAYLFFSRLNGDVITHIEKFSEKPWDIRKKCDNFIWRNINIELQNNHLWISAEICKFIDLNLNSPNYWRQNHPQCVKRYVGRSEIVCYHWYR